MFAEIIAIGSELTCGSKLDTNSQWLSRELESVGWTVARHTTLADDLVSTIAEIRAASERSSVVLITGGLGPTLDDLTREALAAAFYQPLVRDKNSVRQIEALFAARGRVMPERNYRQADRPLHADTLPNSCGTAPGILMKVARQNSTTCLLAAMPGVPAEMRPMFELQIRPHLLDSGVVMRRRVIRTFGYGESDAERLLGDLTARGRNPEVGITASEAVISLWITARSDSPEEAETLCNQTAALIHERLGDAVYSEDNSELHQVVADQLTAQSRTIALREGSTTGGLLALWMTESARSAQALQSATVSPNLALEPIDREAWEKAARTEAYEYFRAQPAADFVLLSSPHHDEITESGVTVRRGWVGVAAEDRFFCMDVSMSGNLAIFRQRAARTALNRLRLMLADAREV